MEPIGVEQSQRESAAAAEDDGWYLEVRGRRAGPFPWRVIRELAEARALAPDDLLWRQGHLTGSRVGDLPQLAVAPFPAGLGGNSAERSVRPPASAAPLASREAKSRADALLLFGAALWIAVTAGFCVLRFEGWPGVLDGVLTARLDTAGVLLLLLPAAGLPALWRRTRSGAGGPSGIGAGALRILAAACAVMLLATVVSTVANSRVLFWTAMGDDPLGRAQIRVLPGGREVEVRGMIEAGLAARLARVLRAHPQIRFVHLNSPGGWIAEGVRLARLIHAKGLGTYTATGCYSACVLAFVAGRPRVLNPQARLGLHSARSEGTDPLFIAHANEVYQRTLRRYGVSPRFVAWSTVLQSKKVWMPTRRQLLANHLIDQVSDAGFADSGESLSQLAARASRYEARYPFLADLKETAPQAFAALDRSIRLALRRALPNAGLDTEVAAAAADTERRLLSRVGDAQAARYAAGLRSAAAALQASDPLQCVAILGPQSVSRPTRSSASLSAISPALATLLDASFLPGTTVVDSRRRPEADPVSPPAQITEADVLSDPALQCDRLLAGYNAAIRGGTGPAAALVRALRGG